MAVLQEYVHALVKHVTGNFDDLLMHVLVVARGAHDKVGIGSSERNRVRTGCTGARKRAVDIGIALRRPESNNDVVAPPQ